MKRLKVEIWNLQLRWGTYESFFVHILEEINRVIRVSEPNNEMPIVSLNSVSSKTNRTRGIKLTNLEESGHAFSALKNKPWRFRHFFSFFLSFFLSLFIYSANHIMVTNTQKPPKLETFGQIVSLYINLRHCNFGGASSRGLGHMHSKLVTANFVKWFYSHTKATNLKFGQMISLYMNLGPLDFGRATSRGLGHMHPKLVTAKFITWI